MLDKMPMTRRAYISLSLRGMAAGISLLYVPSSKPQLANVDRWVPKIENPETPIANNEVFAKTVMSTESRYKKWHVVDIPWTESTSVICATKYAFNDLRSPVVSKQYFTGHRITAIASVSATIDTIETEGFEKYMRRVFPESRRS